ncbi:MAG: cytochrome c-type biogenesis protein CcmH [Acidimicrobiales bacterium]|nr:cytochrome c-type biogenesis protein CcmH [Acidimicrobiales bacterium]
MNRFRWLALVALVLGALVVSEVATQPVLTNADRAHQLAENFACPVCSGQSVAESDVPIARAIRTEIARMVDEGATDAMVRTELVDSFGQDIDYTPQGSGLIGLVWVLPVVLAVAAVTGLALALRRWSGASTGRASAKKSSRPMVLLGIAVLAVGAGLLVAQTSGSRGVGETGSGEIRSSTRTLLAQAGVAAPQEAITLYTEVLELQPSNVEALTYRAWALWRSGGQLLARVDINDAVTMDPAYPDARVFRASMLFADEEAAAAAQDLLVLDTLAAPPIVGDLLAASHLRERIASSLAAQGDLLTALTLLDSGIEVTAQPAPLLAERGWLLAVTFEPDLLGLAVEALDEALALEPAHPNALAYRALVRSVLLEDAEGAAADAASFAALADPPTALVELLTTEGLLG